MKQFDMPWLTAAMLWYGNIPKTNMLSCHNIILANIDVKHVMNDIYFRILALQNKMAEKIVLTSLYLHEFSALHLLDWSHSSLWYYCTRVYELALVMYDDAWFQRMHMHAYHCTRNSTTCWQDIIHSHAENEVEYNRNILIVITFLKSALPI